jgi:hypothetical protein
MGGEERGREEASIRNRRSNRRCGFGDCCSNTGLAATVQMRGRARTASPAALSTGKCKSNEAALIQPEDVTRLLAKGGAGCR